MENIQSKDRIHFNPKFVLPSKTPAQNVYFNPHFMSHISDSCAPTFVTVKEVCTDKSSNWNETKTCKYLNSNEMKTGNFSQPIPHSFPKECIKPPRIFLSDVASNDSKSVLQPSMGQECKTDFYHQKLHQSSSLSSTYAAQTHSDIMQKFNVSTTVYSCASSSEIRMTYPFVKASSYASNLSHHTPSNNDFIDVQSNSHNNCFVNPKFLAKSNCNLECTHNITGITAAPCSSLQDMSRKEDVTNFAKVKLSHRDLNMSSVPRSSGILDPKQYSQNILLENNDHIKENHTENFISKPLINGLSHVSDCQMDAVEKSHQCINNNVFVNPKFFKGHEKSLYSNPNETISHCIHPNPITPSAVCYNFSKTNHKMVPSDVLKENCKSIPKKNILHKNLSDKSTNSSREFPQDKKFRILDSLNCSSEEKDSLNISAAVAKTKVTVCKSSIVQGKFSWKAPTYRIKSPGKLNTDKLAHKFKSNFPYNENLYKNIIVHPEVSTQFAQAGKYSTNNLKQRHLVNLNRNKSQQQKDLSLKFSPKMEQLQNKDLRPVVVLTKRKLIRKRTNSATYLPVKMKNTYPISPSNSKYNSHYRINRKYLNSAASKSIIHKYSVLSRNKLVRRNSSCDTTQQGKSGQARSYHCQAAGMHLRDAHCKGRVKVRESSSFAKKRDRASILSEGIKKSDNFVKIGSAMYKITSTSLKRQVAPVKATHSAYDDVCTFRRNCITNYRRWHTGTSWSHCWGPCSKPRTSTIFPSLTFIMLNNKLNRTYDAFRKINNTHRVYISNANKVINPDNYSNMNSCSSSLEAANKTRLVLAEHALKAQMLQRLITAAKQRSVLVLQRKATRKWKANADTSTVATSAVSSAPVNSRDERSVPYCRFYHRFGRCHRGDSCPYEHNPERVAICTRFLRGRCRVPHCVFTHTVNRDKMPLCSHFLRGALCTKDDCPYLHVNPNRSAPICEPFLHGHCDKREKCKLQHVLECSEYLETGRCPRGGGCPLPHSTRRRCKAIRADATKDGNGAGQGKQRKRRRTVSGDGEVLGVAYSGNKRKKGRAATAADCKESKQQRVRNRYFRSDENLFEESAVKKDKKIIQEEKRNEGFSPLKQPCDLLSEKKQRIMLLVEKMQSRRIPSANISSDTRHSRSKLQAAAPAPTTGKYKVVEEEKVISVQPLMQFLTDRSLPSFIPLSCDKDHFAGCS